MTENRSSVWGSVIILGIMFLLVAGLLCQLLVIGPSQLRTYDEFGLQLPYLSLQIFKLVRFASSFWWLCILFSSIGLVSYSSGILLLRHRLRWPILTSLIAILATMLVIILNLTILFATQYPKVKLLEGLSK
jgi:hypothetical protein